MDKLKVGVVINMVNGPASGGGYFYVNKLIQQIDDFEFDPSLDVCYVVKDQQLTQSLKKEVVTIQFTSIAKSKWSLKNRLKRKLLSLTGMRLELKEFEHKINTLINVAIEDHLKEQKVDILYYLEPTGISLNYPYIITHWDLGHKTTFAFPEVSMHGIYRLRENYNRDSLGKALAIFAESEESKKELILYDRINRERIFVVPLFAGAVVDMIVHSEKQEHILSQWKLESSKYFFYPAQFWSHKNHYALVMAFKKVHSAYPETKLVLSGSDKGNLNYIADLIRTNDLSDSVVITGFISDEEVNTFYKNAICLVMPTYLGPTNMPLLEAHYLGCRVLCSNLEGHREQMGENAIYFDPANFDDIAEAMLATVGVGRLSGETIPRTQSNPVKAINDHLVKIRPVRKTFGFEYK